MFFPVVRRGPAGSVLENRVVDPQEMQTRIRILVSAVVWLLIVANMKRIVEAYA